MKVERSATNIGRIFKWIKFSIEKVYTDTRDKVVRKVEVIVHSYEDMTKHEVEIFVHVYMVQVCLSNFANCILLSKV
jgi:hypothetical protein